MRQVYLGLYAGVMAENWSILHRGKEITGVH